MKRLLGAIIILLVLGSSANASSYVYIPRPPIAPPATPTPSGPGPSSSQKFFCVVNPAGYFICAVLIGIIVHEVRGPKCARPGLKNGYDSPTFWRPLCNWKDPISVRG